MCGRPPTILSMYQNQTTLWPLFDQHLPSYENNTDSIAVLKRQVPLSSADGLAAILKHERSKTSINLACKPRQGTSSPNSRRSHHHTRRVAVIESLLASETVKRNYTMQGFQNILSFDVLTTTGIKKTWRHIRASGADGPQSHIRPLYTWPSTTPAKKCDLWVDGYQIGKIMLLFNPKLNTQFENLAPVSSKIHQQIDGVRVICLM